MKCKNCNTEITRTLDPRVKNHFCSRSCAATYNNKIYPKRQKENIHICNVCGSFFRKRCEACRNQDRETALDYTVGYLKELSRDKNGLSLASKIRGYGKWLYDKSNRPKFCVVCGYDQHYEVCHIRAVSSFPDDATMREVHAEENLIALCPNCHWEFDHGMLEI